MAKPEIEYREAGKGQLRMILSYLPGSRGLLMTQWILCLQTACSPAIPTPMIPFFFRVDASANRSCHQIVAKRQDIAQVRRAIEIIFGLRAYVAAEAATPLKFLLVDARSLPAAGRLRCAQDDNLESQFQGGGLFLFQGYRTVGEPVAVAADGDASFDPPFLRQGGRVKKRLRGRDGEAVELNGISRFRERKRFQVTEIDDEFRNS